MRRRSNPVYYQRVQGLFDALLEFITTGNDFYGEIVEVFTSHFHGGALEVVGTLHLRNQVRTASLDTLEFGAELLVQSDPLYRIPIPCRFIAFGWLHQ
jgi:hypothetical protein